MDADDSQLVVGQHVSQSAGDFAELENGVAGIPSQLGMPESVLADAGDVNADAFDRQEQEGVEIYCMDHRRCRFLRPRGAKRRTASVTLDSPRKLLRLVVSEGP